MHLIGTSIEKTIAVAECIKHTALANTNTASKLHEFTRKMPRIKSKRTNKLTRRYFKKNIAFLHAQLAINSVMGAVQLSIILSQPTPKNNATKTQKEHCTYN